MGLPGSSSYVCSQSPKVLIVFSFLNLLPYMHGIVIHCVDVREVLSIYPPLQFPSPPGPTSSGLPHPYFTVTQPRLVEGALPQTHLSAV